MDLNRKPELGYTNGLQGFGVTKFAQANYKEWYLGTSGLHGGFDFSTPEVTPVVAGVNNAKVVQLGDFPESVPDSNPNVVLEVNDLWIVYGHVVPKAGLMKGQILNAGDVIGTLDSLFSEIDSEPVSDSHLHLAITTWNTSAFYGGDDKVTTYNPVYSLPQNIQALMREDNSGYIDGEDAFSIYSFQYSAEKTFWDDDGASFGLVRP